MTRYFILGFRQLFWFRWSPFYYVRFSMSESSGFQTCNRPPDGWYCKLPRDHEGSCPTYPTSDMIQVGIANALEAKDVQAATALMAELAIEDPEAAEYLLDAIKIFTKKS